MNWLSTLSILAAGGHSDVETPGLLQPEVSLIVWTWVSFLVLLFILGKFAWGPISKLLRERAEKIEGEIERARKLREDAETRLAEYQKQLEQVHKEMEKLREDGRTQGEELKRRIEEQAKKDANETRERATKEVDLMVNKARAELRDLAVTLALQAAEAVTRKSLTDADHKRYAEEAIAQVGDLGAKH